MQPKGIIFFDELLFQRLNNTIEFTRIVKENHFEHIPESLNVAYYETFENTDSFYILAFLSSIYNSFLGIALDFNDTVYLFDKVPDATISQSEKFKLTKIAIIPNAWEKALELIKEQNPNYIWYKDYRNRIYTDYIITNDIITFSETLP